MAWSDHVDAYGLTNTEAKLFEAVKAGGMPTREQLQVGVIGKRFASPNLVPVHINRMNLKLARHGLAVVCGRHGTGYQVKSLEERV